MGKNVEKGIFWKFKNPPPFNMYQNNALN